MKLRHDRRRLGVVQARHTVVHFGRVVASLRTDPEHLEPGALDLEPQRVAVHTARLHRDLHAGPDVPHVLEVRDEVARLVRVLPAQRRVDLLRLVHHRREHPVLRHVDAHHHAIARQPRQQAIQAHFLDSNGPILTLAMGVTSFNCEVGLPA